MIELKFTVCIAVHALAAISLPHGGLDVIGNSLADDRRTGSGLDDRGLRSISRLARSSLAWISRNIS